MSNRYECNAFEYNFAILVRIPDSFQNSARKFDPEAEIDMEKARKEHKDLVETLKKCDVRTIELDGTEEYPECPFVDDCVVAIGNTALITRPGSKTRQGEVSEIRRYLQSQMKMTIVEIRDPDAIVEGGDVLFTGKEIFVGIGTGRRTNEKGAQAQMKSLAQYKYRILRLDSDDAANMLYVNGRLIHRSRDEIGEKSYSILDEKITYAKHKVGFEEISKTGGYLSSAVLLINRNKKPNSIVSNITREDTTNFSEWRSM
ncbi:DDAH [Mytilus coruscus]|uniref:DDAH n=1 Tax=Mytilus coruscus TaxID=42192 RepID=A0A6J8BIS7_MYTCO|nr:DDAH [Mytilus coruscus]